MHSTATSFQTRAARSRHARSHWNPKHWLLLSGLLLLLLGNHLEHLHSLVAEHTYCEVHAQLEHRAEADAEPLDSEQAEQAEGTHPASPESGVQLAKSVDDEAHLACTLTLLAPRDEALLSSDISTPGPPLDFRPVLWSAHAQLPSKRLLYRLAPKNSPPQA